MPMAATIRPMIKSGGRSLVKKERPPGSDLVVSAVSAVSVVSVVLPVEFCEFWLPAGGVASGDGVGVFVEFVAVVSLTTPAVNCLSDTDIFVGFCCA